MKHKILNFLPEIINVGCYSMKLECSKTYYIFEN